LFNLLTPSQHQFKHHRLARRSRASISSTLKKSSTPTNNLGAGVRYKPNQPEQNKVLLINKHTVHHRSTEG
jgi:hypothetical protein